MKSCAIPLALTLALATLGARPALAQDQARADQVEPGFTDKYFPFFPPKDPSPEIVRKLPWFYLASGLSCIAGPLWIPGLVLEGGAPDGALGEAVIAWIIYLGIQWVSAPLVFIGVGWPLVLLNTTFWGPMAVMGIYDRALKRQQAAAPRSTATPALETGLAAPPAAAVGMAH